MFSFFITIIFFILGFVLGVVTLGYSLLKDKTYVKLKENEIIINREDFSYLIAAAPRALKMRLAGLKNYDDVRFMSEEAIKEDQ